MKQILLLLAAIYSLIINQSNKDIHAKKKVVETAVSTHTASYSPDRRLPGHPMITPYMGIVMYTGRLTPGFIKDAGVITQ